MRKIDRTQAIQILKALTAYAQAGVGDVKQLQGTPDWRLRVGDYRIRFEVVSVDTLRILHVKHRREVYR